MTIILSRPLTFGGVTQPPGTTHNLGAEMEASLVAKGIAEYVGVGAQLSGVDEPARWSDANGTALVRPNGSTVALGGTVSDSISSIVYSNGVVQSITGPGMTASFTYDGQGRVATITENSVTRTVTYNGDGTVASLQ